MESRAPFSLFGDGLRMDSTYMKHFFFESSLKSYEPSSSVIMAVFLLRDVRCVGFSELRSFRIFLLSFWDRIVFSADIVNSIPFLPFWAIDRLLYSYSKSCIFSFFKMFKLSSIASWSLTASCASIMNYRSYSYLPKCFSRKCT